jgi:site-specific DNA-methyltransferase (adenine-specific)
MDFEIQNQRLAYADWRKFLPSLKSDSVDLLLTDPPYGTTSLVWDKKVDWERFWAEAHRVCKPLAPMILFASGKFVPELINSNFTRYRYELVWEKTLAVGHLDANRRPLRAHEWMLVFTQAFRGSTYNPQMVEGKPHTTGGVKKKPEHYGGGFNEIKKVVTNLYHPRSVLKYSNKVHGKSLHPTAKPLELVEWLVRSYSNAGDVVLDPFSGSGTTLAASMIAGRRGIGCEISPEYYETAKQRLAELTSALNDVE